MDEYRTILLETAAHDRLQAMEARDLAQRWHKAVAANPHHSRPQRLAHDWEWQADFYDGMSARFFAATRT